MSLRSQQNDSIVGIHATAFNLSRIPCDLACLELRPPRVHKDRPTTSCGVVHKLRLSCQKHASVSTYLRDGAASRGVQAFEATLVNAQLASQQKDGTTKRRAKFTADPALKSALCNGARIAFNQHPCRG